MAKYAVPYTYVMYGVLIVEADSAKKAIDKVLDDNGDLKGEYKDDSFKVNQTEVKLYNGELSADIS